MPELKVTQDEMKMTIDVPQNENLLKVLSNNGFELNTYCGGKGLCGKCKVKIIKGQNNLHPNEKKLLTEKEIKNGIRLACLTDIKNDMIIELEETKDIIALTSGIIPDIDFDLLINKETITLEKPSLKDQRDFLQRIYDLTETNNINMSSLSILNEINKEKTLTITTSENKVINIENGKTQEDFYGLAIDIGTTTIVIYLLDLYNKKNVDNFSIYNPQKKYGADVISRINFSIDEEWGSKKLKQELISGLNQGIEKLKEKNNIKQNDILMASIAGNTVMMHTLLGMETETIAHSPYIPLFTDNLELTPEECGININKNGKILLLPSISGYVGADIVGDMLAVNFEEKSNTNDLLIDIGTNGEIVLSTGDEIFACSTAAGPAFEGANITFGMAGIHGAVSKFSLNKDGEIFYQTIKNETPQGICGSGLLDIVAQLHEYNLLDKNGTLLDKEKIDHKFRKYLTNYNDLKSFKIVDKSEAAGDNDILITQKDIREVQLAKGAIQAGINILIKEIGIENKDIDNIFIAGGFGNYIDPHNACQINLIPEELEHKITLIGNGAGAGAQLYLLDKKARSYVNDIKKRVKYIELSSRSDFQTEFMASMQF